jgi:hypothetical protein
MMTTTVMLTTVVKALPQLGHFRAPLATVCEQAGQGRICDFTTEEFIRLPKR